MSRLLIHSMSELTPLVMPALEAVGARRIVEVGAEHAGMSAFLAAYVNDVNGALISIDPQPSSAFRDWLKTTKSVTHIEQPSLPEVGRQRDIDAWILDGDHNWYTVVNELRAIRAAGLLDGKPMLTFLHDVSWPCARRDAYYAPDRIPQEYRNAYSYDGGVHLDSMELFHDRGFRGRGQFAWALEEGGPHNGVLTAVEDFVVEEQEHGRALGWACVPAVFGLGVLFDLDAPWAQALANVLSPWHNNPILMSLEENRLRNYLSVLDLQDSAAVHAATPAQLVA